LGISDLCTHNTANRRPPPSLEQWLAFATLWNHISRSAAGDKLWLFGGEWAWGDTKMFLVPLLAVPQLTHYVLDGFIWRRNSHPDFRLI
jgi:hypothetical protein